MKEPPNKRVSFFVDGQNLFHSVKAAFGCPFPNYDIRKLTCSICEKQRWDSPASINFYTGIPSRNINPAWHDFWRQKTDGMREQGIHVFSRPLSYSNKVGREKGIDIRIALDVTRAVLEDSCDVAVILSQDQDLSEVAKEVRRISKKENRWIKIASAFPINPTSGNSRGINNTDWIKINREMYDECTDSNDYRLKAR